MTRSPGAVDREVKMPMIAPFLAAGMLLLLAPAGIALAQEADRYTMERTDSGYVRLDRRTGEMTLCHERDGQLVCRLGADERTALMQEIERLGDRVAALEERVGDLGAAGRQATPSPEEFEQTLGMMERFFRRFWEIVRDFERDMREAEPDSPAPQRT
jgi:hypothetical protein